MSRSLYANGTPAGQALQTNRASTMKILDSIYFFTLE